jgi:hypothetical protein
VEVTFDKEYAEVENEQENPVCNFRPPLTPAELDCVREQILESIYADIGKSIVRKLLWVVGAACFVFLAWMNGAGHITFKS